MKVKRRSYRLLGSSLRIQKSGETRLAHMKIPDMRSYEAPMRLAPGHSWRSHW
jgi:hypothetical protein